MHSSLLSERGLPSEEGGGGSACPMALWEGRPPPPLPLSPVNRMTGRYINITFPKPSLRAVKRKMGSYQAATHLSLSDASHRLSGGMLRSETGIVIGYFTNIRYWQYCKLCIQVYLNIMILINVKLAVNGYERITFQG